jgi:hypothetical protein
MQLKQIEAATLLSFSENMKEYNKNLFKQIKSKFPHLTANRKNEILTLVNQFWKNIIHSMGGLKSMSDYYREAYSKNFSESEIDQLLTYYSSGLGEKEVKIKVATGIAFQDYYSKEMSEIYKQHLNALWKELDSLQ